MLALHLFENFKPADLFESILLAASAKAFCSLRN